MIHENLAADFFILYSAKACVCGTLSDGYVPDMAAIPPDRTIILRTRSPPAERGQGSEPALIFCNFLNK